MRGVVGTINDGVYCSVTVDFNGVDNWTDNKSLLKNRRETHLGSFRSLTKDTPTNGKVYLNYTDFTNKIQIILTEEDTSPRVRISINLPNPDKYNVSSFFVSGHFNIQGVNVISANRVFTGPQLNDPLKSRKDIKLLDKILFTWEEDPKVRLIETETPFGNIVSVNSPTYLEI